MLRRTSARATLSARYLPMALIADTNPEHMRVYGPRRRSTTWRFIKRHGLVELIVILGGICLAWLGVALGSGQI